MSAAVVIPAANRAANPDGEARVLAQESIGRVGGLPTPTDITAAETVALTAAKDSAAKAEARRLAMAAVMDLCQVFQAVTRLAELCGTPDGGPGGQR